VTVKNNNGVTLQRLTSNVSTLDETAAYQQQWRINDMVIINGTWRSSESQMSLLSGARRCR